MPGRGYSLLEVVISLGLLALVMITLIGLFLSSQWATHGSRGSSAASTLLSAELTRLKVRPFGQLEAMVGVAQPAKKVTQDGIEFTLNLTVERFSTNPVQADYRVLRLQAQADWREARLDTGGSRTAQRVLESQVGGASAY